MAIDTPPAPAAPALRERTRRAVRAELTDVAMDLFLRRGFDATTVDEIAAAAGISRRSLFRYFASKEAIIFDNLQDIGEQLAEALAGRPRAEDPWTSLRHTFELVIAFNQENPVRTLGFYEMLEETPALKARYFEQQMRWQELLVPDITVRLGRPEGEDEYGACAAAVVGSALACLFAANNAWRHSQGKADVVRLLDDAMRTVTVRPADF
jgi:AcrR family transcriptional regulator